MNKLRSGFVGAFLGIFVFALFSPGPLTSRRPASAVAPSAISHVRNSSVNVEVELVETNLFGEVETGVARGSGVIFHRFGKTYALTAQHVVEGIPYHGPVKIYQGDAEWDAILVNADETHDLALLRLDSRTPVGTSVELSSEALLPVGTRLLHVGNLLGRLPGSYVEGVLSAVGRDLGGLGQFDQTTLNAWPGSSGGGVFTTDGKLVGILTRGVGPGLNFIVPARVLRQWADENDLHWLFE
jgi:S1-C subfamily serine protease